jgi:antitoxin CptB
MTMTDPEPHATKVKRLHMRSMRRGIKEMDLILIRYAEARLAAMDAQTLNVYDELLSENDQDLYQWVTGQVDAPSRFASLVADIRQIATG